MPSSNNYPGHYPNFICAKFDLCRLDSLEAPLIHNYLLRDQVFI